MIAGIVVGSSDSQIPVANPLLKPSVGTGSQTLPEFRFSAEFEKVVMAFASAPWIVYWSERTLTIAQLQIR